MYHYSAGYDSGGRCEGAEVYRNSITSVQFFYEPETALKISIFLKKENYTNCKKYNERDNVVTLAV